MKEALALLLAYLLGSLPSAYLVTRRLTGRDIRQLGGGNVGALNTLQEVGMAAGAIVFVLDVVKGALAVMFAWLLRVPAVFIILAGFAAVVGHLWMPWLGFHGGKGVGAALGAIAALFLIYGHGLLLLAFLFIIALPLLLTRNVALAMALGLFALPFIVWLGTRSGWATLMALVLFALLGFKYLPTMLGAFRRDKGRGMAGIIMGEGRVGTRTRPKARPD
jgi:acyl phosphate:glycerol-3-phosphate acyltransferase